MKKLQMLSAAAGILLAIAGPSLAAQRTHQGSETDASGAVSTDRSGAYYYGPSGGAQDALRAQGRAAEQPQYYRGQNLPYADRPYGDPDGW